MSPNDEWNKFVGIIIYIFTKGESNQRGSNRGNIWPNFACLLFISTIEGYLNPLFVTEMNKVN